MKLKLDEQGHVVLQDGKPVYVHDDGKEIAFDAPQTVATISRLNGEAKGHRERAEKAETSLKAFEGLDPEAARKAVETVANLDSKSLIAAGEVEKIKTETAKAYEGQLKSLEEKYKPIVKERDALQERLVSQQIGGAFGGSKFIADKLAIPADIARAAFGQHFKVEGDVIVGYDNAGAKIYSRERPGEVAGFDEALGLLVESYPRRDSILKGSGASGSGAGGSNGSGAGKSLTRAAFDALAADQRSAHVRAGGTVTD